MNVPSEWPSCSTMGAPFDVRIGAFSQSYRAASTEQFLALDLISKYFFSPPLCHYIFFSKFCKIINAVLLYVSYWYTSIHVNIGIQFLTSRRNGRRARHWGHLLKCGLKRSTGHTQRRLSIIFFSRGPSRCHLKAVVTEAIFFFLLERNLVVIW